MDNKTKQKIAQLRHMLSDTDAIAVRYLDGLITLEEYQPVKEKRVEWMAELKRLESDDKEDV